MINKTGQQLSEQLVSRIAMLERSLRALKTVQLVGQGNLPLDASTPATSSYTLAAGASRAITVTFHSSADTLYLSDLHVTFFINTDMNANYCWPVGSSLTADLLAFERSVTTDWYLSHEAVDGTKVYVIFMKNTGTATKTVYLHYQLTYLRGAVIS